MTRDWSTAREFGRSMQGLHLLQEGRPADLSGDDVLFLMNVNEIPADAQPKKVTISGLAEASSPFVVAGSNTQIQYNNNGDFGASADLTWDDSAKELGVGGDINLDDGGTYSTTLQMVTPTANRTISFPDATGTVALVAGSTGQLTYNNAGAQAGLTSANIGSTDEINISLAGAASTPPVSFTGSWFTGGTATTTKPQLLIEPTGTTSTAWSTGGTGLGVNAASGFGGNLLDLQVNGSSAARVDSNGTFRTVTDFDGRSAFLYGSIYLLAGDIHSNTGNGTKIGTATTQKLGFYNATPVVQPAAVADATDAATVITQLNDLLAKLRTLGLIAT